MPPATSVAQPVQPPVGARAVPTPTIQVGQVFNYKVLNPSLEIGRVGMVWGARTSKPAGITNLLYVSSDVAPRSMGAWLTQAHPDWIERRCDRSVPFQFGHAGLPIDFANPDVQQWLIDAVVAPAVAAGYSGVGFDNLWLYNAWERCGHYSADGRWVRQYSGKIIDSTYMNDVVAWAEAMRARVHALKPGFLFALNYSYYIGGIGTATQQSLVDTADIWLDECGVTRCGQGKPRASAWAAMQSMISAFRGCYFANDEMDTSDQAMRGWAVANYLLTKRSCSYLAIEKPQQYGTLLDFPEYSIDAGVALEAGHALGNLWVRRYSKLTVQVDPTDGSYLIAYRALQRVF